MEVSSSAERAWHGAAVAAEVVAQLHLAGQLRGALERDEFVLHYQPAYELRSGRCVGVEALIRWQHPERGLLPPGQFLDTAEATGLLGPIGVWVTDAAIRQHVEMASADAVAAHVPTMWINAAPSHLEVAGFAARMLEQLADAGVDPVNVGLEVTEAAMIGSQSTIVTELEHLRGVGIRIAIDDFGTGYSSLSRLGSLPIDVIKIDRSFIRDLSNRAGRAIVEAIIALAHAIDAVATAEGVESLDELAHLRDMGCDQVSGFLLARPVPAAELDDAVVRGGSTLAATSEPQSRGRATRNGTGRRPFGWGRTKRAAAAEAVTASVDAVTGLGNRRGLRARLTDLLSAGRQPILLLVDLDGFRAFGLMHDHESADLLLRAQCQRLRAVEAASAYRLEADLFALVLDDRRRGPVSTQLDLDELTRGPKGTTACVGVAHAHAQSTVEELLRRAERALVTAKRRGSGSVIDGAELADGSRTVDSAQARSLYSVLRTGSLRVHYQPIFSLADDSVIGYEALVRPQFDHGLAGPEEAFRVAAQLGLVPELDAVCRSSIFSDGPGFDMAAGTRLFVNVAPEALGHRSLRQSELGRQIEHAGLERSRVVFELHESPTVPPEVFVEEARHVIDRGFAVALDDAGGPTGSLQTMRSVPFTYIKLAPGLLGGARDEAAVAATLDALCTFARHAVMRVIATGVSSPHLLAQARVLRGGDDGPRIHAAQGYHLGKPRPQAKPHPR